MKTWFKNVWEGSGAPEFMFFWVFVGGSAALLFAVGINWGSILISLFLSSCWIVWMNGVARNRKRDKTWRSHFEF